MAPKGSDRVVKKIVAENRKARYNYEIIDTYEAGIMLMGTEVKSLREGKANIAESYASDENGEIWLINSYLPEYLQANRFNHEPRRRRKLLLSGREINRLRVGINREGMTLIPLKIYFNDRGRAKMELALAKGKKLHDKRQSEKERDWKQLRFVMRGRYHFQHREHGLRMPLAIFRIHGCKLPVDLGRIPDIDHHRHLAEHLEIAVDNPRHGRIEVSKAADPCQFGRHALPSERIVVLRKRADDRRLVGKVLIERSEGYAGALYDIAHLQRFAALFRDQFRRHGENFFDALAATLLHRNASRSA
jgi:SsrA-binding protein